jgi:hypothetical protein
VRSEVHRSGGPQGPVVTPAEPQQELITA